MSFVCIKNTGSRLRGKLSVSFHREKVLQFDLSENDYN